MPAPVNALKSRLLSGQMQIGLWLGLASPTVAEIAAAAGFDWCLIDGEHAPNTLQGIHAQLQAMNGQGADAVVRVPVGADWVLKQVLDLGAQTVLVPMVDDWDGAEAAARAVRYPPVGRRGVGASLARASGYSRIDDYMVNANDEICLIVQAESARAFDHIDDIASVEGVDAVFIGPADLAADMGYPDRTDAPEVVAVIEHMIARIRAAGKVAGTLTLDPATVSHWRDLGVGFLGVGADVITLTQALEKLARNARTGA